MERKQVPDIPGVSRGFPAGVPIETAASLQVERVKGSFPNERADIFLVDVKRRDYLKLPFLGIDATIKPPAWVPRYDPITGDVYTMRWNKPDLGVELNVADSSDGLFVELKNKKYLVVGGEKYYYLKSTKKMAKKWDIQQLVPQKVVDGIEAAMRQQDEIMRDYHFDTGVETEQVTDILSQIKGVFEYLNEGILSEHTFRRVAAQTEQIFQRHGLLTAKDPLKSDVVKKLKELSIRDRFGRRNPSAAKWKLISGLLKVVKRKLVTGFVSDKAVRTFSILL